MKFCLFYIPWLIVFAEAEYNFIGLLNFKKEDNGDIQSPSVKQD